jgi:hypothetical protein
LPEGLSDPLAGRAPEARSAPLVTGAVRRDGELRCSRGVWDDRDLSGLGDALRVAARRGADRGRWVRELRDEVG